MKRFLIQILFIMCVILVPFKIHQPSAQTQGISASKTSSIDNYYLKIAKNHIEQKDYSKAIDTLKLALLLEPNNKEVQLLLEETARLVEKEKKSDVTQSKTGTSKKQTEVISDSDVTITKLVQDVYTALKEERYEDAEKIVDFILAKDPANKDVLYIKELLNNLKHSNITENLRTLQAQEKLRNLEYLREASIPYQDTIRLPPKDQWQNISKRMLPELDRIVEENKRKTVQLQIIPDPVKEQYSKVIEDALNTILTFEFLDTPLKDVIAFVREKTNINVIVDAEAENISVTLKLKDITLRVALNYMLPKGYEYVIEGDILHFNKQKLELRVYDVRDILINMDDKEPLRFDITAAATSQMGLSKGEVVEVKDASERVFDLIELVVTTIEPPSWSYRTSIIGATAGGQRRINIPGQGEGSVVARVGQPGDLVIVNSKYVHGQVANLLASLRSSQNLQVNIEARFITVSDEFMEDIGSNLTKFFSDDSSITTGAEGIENGLNLNYSILNDSMLIGFLRAVQESKGSEILTSPRITLSNTQRGNIAVIKTTNYVQSTSVSEGVVTPVIGTIPEGTTFDVRPIISADRKYVYLEVTPSIFDVVALKEFTFSGLNSDANIGGGGTGITNIPPQQTIQLPELNVSQVSVTVCVPDKGTLMIGGLGSITKENLATGIPLLSKIPFIKRLFSREQKNNLKSNLIILLKPTVLIREEQEANINNLSSQKLRLTNSKKSK
ncbi:MAG TPA: hypothetical protein ACFYEE_06660 [Candidatus Wujingus californicus]|uniref:hypothetical protein n=1 Tax=Candidatus Wujingus californicus TaxID=3367618 RepID=UPI004026728B